MVAGSQLFLSDCWRALPEPGWFVVNDQTVATAIRRSDDGDLVSRVGVGQFDRRLSRRPRRSGKARSNAYSFHRDICFVDALGARSVCADAAYSEADAED